MKYRFTFIFLHIVILSGSCTDNDQITVVTSQTAVVYAAQYTSLEGTARTVVHGSLYGDPYPVIKRVLINKMVNGLNPSSIDVRDNYFRIDQDTLLSRIELQLETSRGSLFGVVRAPINVDTILLPTLDTIPLGASFTITINGGNYDYVSLWGFYTFYDGAEHYVQIDTSYYGKSVTLPSAILHHNGLLEIWSLTLENGPFLEENVSGNLSGDGNGFFRYQLSHQINRAYQIGTGLPSN